MRRFLISLLVVFAGVSLAGQVVAGPPDDTAQVASPKGEVLVSPEERFSMVFPDGFPPPQKDVTGVTSYTSVSGNRFCGVMVNKIGSWLEGSTDTSVLNNIQRAVNLANAEDITQSDFILHGHSARTLTYIQREHGKWVYNRLDLVVAKPQMYQLFYTSPSKADLNLPDTQTFFESLTLQR